MATESDLLSQWLLIPLAEQPPDHYRLFGLKQFEAHPLVIRESADKQIAAVQERAKQSHETAATSLLSQLNEAKASLLHPKRKREYDAALREKLNLPGPAANKPAGSSAPTRIPASSTLASQRRVVLIVAGVACACALIAYGAFSMSGDPKQSSVAQEESDDRPVAGEQPQEANTSEISNSVQATARVTSTPAHSAAVPPVERTAQQRRVVEPVAKTPDQQPLEPESTDEPADNTANKRYLSDMRPRNVKALNNWFGVKGSLGHTTKSGESQISVAGKPSANGITMHPAADDYAAVTFKLGKRWKTLHATVAIGDMFPQGSATPLTFRVLGDGRSLWHSEPLQEPNQQQDCTVNVTDVDLLELRVRCPGQAFRAHGIWLDPYLSRE